MILHWDRQPSIVHIASEPLYDIGDQRLFAIIGQCQELRRIGHGAYPTRNKPSRRRMAHGAMVKPDVDVPWASIKGQLPQFLGCVE